MKVFCPHSKCGYPVYISDADVLSEAASIHNSKRKTHGTGHAGGRPRGYRKCPKCQKMHHPEGKCKA